MAFEKGHEKIAGSGRQKGTKNQNAAIRDWIRSFTLEYLADGFEADFRSLKPAERVKIQMEMFKYTVPTMSSVKIEDDSASVTARDTLRDIISYTQ